MTANPGKFQKMFLRSSINNDNITIIVENKHIKSAYEVKLTKHISNLCNTASDRLRALKGIRKLLS